MVAGGARIMWVVRGEGGGRERVFIWKTVVGKDVAGGRVSKGRFVNATWKDEEMGVGVGLVIVFGRDCVSPMTDLATGSYIQPWPQPG